jgi:hypothetical protein
MIIAAPADQRRLVAPDTAARPYRPTRGLRRTAHACPALQMTLITNRIAIQSHLTAAAAVPSVKGTRPKLAIEVALDFSCSPRYWPATRAYQEFPVFVGDP